MNLIIYTNDDCMERVKIECNPGEWLILNKALRQFVENKENHQTDRMIASEMCKEEPGFTDNSITLEEVKAKCQKVKCKECPYYVVNRVSEYCLFDDMPCDWKLPKG